MEGSKNILDIYSEPLFPYSESQCLFPSSSSSSSPSSSVRSTSSSSEEANDNNDKDKDRDRDPRSKYFPVDSDSFCNDENEDEEILSEGSQEVEFDLADLVVRASAIRQEYLTTGCAELDRVLRGGIPTAMGITELYGDGGSGKTQLCLQLAITAQLVKKEKGLDSGVLYVCTEDVLPSKRLSELAFHFKKRFPDALPDNPMNHIFVEHIADPDDLMECIGLKLEILARQSAKKIRLVILDSVAGIFRGELDDHTKRTMGLRRLARTLHDFSQDHNAAIVVCNQVTANLNACGNIAALGMTWKNMVTIRIRLSKSDNFQHRFLEACFSPDTPTIRVPFQITASGVQAPSI